METQLWKKLTQHPVRSQGPAAGSFFSTRSTQIKLLRHAALGTIWKSCRLLCFTCTNTDLRLHRFLRQMPAEMLHHLQACAPAQ